MNNNLSGLLLVGSIGAIIKSVIFGGVPELLYGGLIGIGIFVILVIKG